MADIGGIGLGVVALMGVLLMGWGYAIAIRCLQRLPGGRGLVKRLLIGSRWPQGAPMGAAWLIVLGLACFAVAIVGYVLENGSPAPPGGEPSSRPPPVHRAPLAG